MDIRQTDIFQPDIGFCALLKFIAARVHRSQLLTQHAEEKDQTDQKGLGKGHSSWEKFETRRVRT